MESIYFVITWLCHRTCRHCYDDRFRPYYGSHLREVVDLSLHNIPRIIPNLPARMTYLDASGDSTPKRGRIILAGGEVLLDPVREPILYPTVRALRERYDPAGGVEILIQTTGDLVRPHLVRELLDTGVDVIAVSGMDDYHEGLDKPEIRDRLCQRLTSMFEDAGMEEAPAAVYRKAGQKYYHFFGATPDSWIGALWPRGRAWKNGLSTATLADNFCNQWSGGLNFLSYGKKGSEVSIDPHGDVFPCCLKTLKPVGNLLEQPLETILKDAARNPVYQAISAGRPHEMGLTHGWSTEKFLERSKVEVAGQGTYENLCIGCDAFHREVLGVKTESELVQLTSQPSESLASEVFMQ